MTTSASLFTGGGIFETGAMMAGFKPVWGVEIRPDIAAVAEQNVPGLKVIVSDVAAVDYSALPKVDHLHASPSCKNASQASNGEEAPEDLSSARAVCRALEEVKPACFTLENVWQYRNFESFKLIVRKLRELGFFVDWWHLNSANYGVPQTRQRLILIARKDRQPRKPQPTHSDTPDAWGVYLPWVGWYEAIADLVDTLPDSQFAPWQLERLPTELKSMLLAQGGYQGEIVNREPSEPSFTVTSNSNQAGVRALLINGAGNTNFKEAKPGKGCRHETDPAQTVTTVTKDGGQLPKAFLVNKSADKYGDGVNYAESRAFSVVATSQGRYKAYIVDGQNDRTFDGMPTIREADQPVYTVSNQAKGAAYALCLGRVVKMTPRALARFQSIPDWYQLPDRNGLACEIIGNGVATLLAKAICEACK